MSQYVPPGILAMNTEPEILLLAFLERILFLLLLSCTHTLDFNEF